MTIRTHDSLEWTELAATAARADALTVPAWVVELARDSDDFALTSVRVDDALSMDGPALESRVAEAYGSIAAKLRQSGARRPVRLWNFIPAITAPAGDGRDRYMAFNAGRYRAFAQWYGGAHAFDRDVATASGVGHDGAVLVIHCLSAREGGIAVANPRQTAPHRYSERFGPVPPCFARATVLKRHGLVLVGGTASIQGEESVHTASLALQLDETLTNLASVVSAAHAKAAGANGNGWAGGDPTRWLGSYRELRVYYPHTEDALTIEQTVRAAFSPACRVEMVRADLCRAELLVEIEGVARLDP
jgi:chorismate lyase/3-hydroxybenzoate synthase